MSIQIKLLITLAFLIGHVLGWILASIAFCEKSK